MQFEMKLREGPFYSIERGVKTVEIRLNDEKRQQLHVGDIITFTLVNDEEEKIETEVVALHKFCTFKELFVSPLRDQCGAIHYTVEECVESMYQYYSKEQEEKYGVLAIELKLLEKYCDYENYKCRIDENGFICLPEKLKELKDFGIMLDSGSVILLPEKTIKRRIKKLNSNYISINRYRAEIDMPVVENGQFKLADRLLKYSNIQPGRNLELVGEGDYYLLKIEKMEDAVLFRKALKYCIQQGKASISLIQRKFGCGYNQAGRIIEQFEDEKLITAFKVGSPFRKVLISMEEYIQRFGDTE